jgi:CubicO group peptidase (beta-lactamase class C family)
MTTRTISGFCHERFAAVEQVFADNFAQRGEVGASVAVMVDGETVVDLWGGTRDRDGTPWEADTLTTVYSCTKGAVALCAHLLIDRGLLDLDAPVGDYWPEFASHGKETATVAMMLNHTVGVPAFRDPLPDGAMADWDLMVRSLEQTEPWWEPGSRNGYHMISFGWTVGELVRRVSGRSLGAFFAEELAGPLDAEFVIGVQPADEPKVAKVIAAKPDLDNPSDFTRLVLQEPASLSHKALVNTGGFNPNDWTYRRAEIGGAGGLANGRGLARLYSPVANGGGELFSPEAVARMGEVSVSTECDEVLRFPTSFALGFMKSMDNRDRPPGQRESVVMGPNAFGHVGAGGSLGFADPDHRLSFGYAMSQMGDGLLLNDRGQTLVDAVYQALGIGIGGS